MVEISRGSFLFLWHPMSNGACLGFGTNPLEDACLVPILLQKSQADLPMSIRSAYT
jgi:hypothetical protein